MVETITPVVHGGRNRSFYSSVVLHTIGATISAAGTGAVLGGIGLAVGAPWGGAGWWAVVAVALLFAARELLAWPIPLPDLDRQVPRWWRSYFAPPVASFLYGIGLGVGFVTYLSFGTLAAVAVAAVASGNPPIGALVVAPFGLARGLSVLTAAAGPPGRILDHLEGQRARRAARWVNGAVLLLVGAVAAVV